MKRLTEFRDGEALDLLADIFEPITEILSDDLFVRKWDGGERLDAVKIALKNHKDSVMEVLAAMDGVPVSEYHCSFFTLPFRLGEIIASIMAEPEIVSFFTQWGQRKTGNPSGSVTANTEEAEK